MSPSCTATPPNQRIGADGARALVLVWRLRPDVLQLESGVRAILARRSSIRTRYVAVIGIKHHDATTPRPDEG
jgi:hypothetical protein